MTFTGTLLGKEERMSGVHHVMSLGASAMIRSHVTVCVCLHPGEGGCYQNIVPFVAFVSRYFSFLQN